jgi:hypothetical protein
VVYFISLIKELPIEVVTANEGIILEAAHIKANYPILLTFQNKNI